MRMELLVQRFMKASNNNKQDVRGTPIGSTAIAQTELPLQEAARAGRLFHGGLQLAANGIAPDAALPTTTAKVALFNADGDGGRSIFIEALHAWLASGTPAAGLTLWVCISRGKLATPVAAMATGFDVGSAQGRSVAASIARWGVAVTLPAATVWFPVGGSLQPAAANFGQSDQPFEVRGGICVPPGYAMGLALLSGAGTTPLYGVGGRWAEMETDLEP